MFLAVYFARFGNWPGELDVNPWSRLSVHFDQPHNRLIARFGPFESQDPNVRIVHCYQREVAAQSTRMLPVSNPMSGVLSL